MAIYEFTKEGLREIEKTSFATAGFYERGDMQQHLRRNIGVILPDVLIISEEFGDWDDSRRRIDLLGIDQDGNVVVIELKRTDDGGLMELQAVRYAAMVSRMTFIEAVRIFESYLQRDGITEDAGKLLQEHLGWPDNVEEKFAQDTKIVLVAADFGKELTTAVMWLRERDIDIRCIRLVPYADDGRLLVDVQQIIPLPEAAEYQVRIREKEQSVRQERVGNTTVQRFWETFVRNTAGRCRIVPRMSSAHMSYIGASTGVRGITFYYVANRNDRRVEIYIDRGEAEVNKEIFHQFEERKEEIEAAFGGELSWQGLFGKRACRVAYLIDVPGDRDDESSWPQIHEALVVAMDRFEKAISPIIPTIKV